MSYDMNYRLLPYPRKRAFLRMHCFEVSKQCILVCHLTRLHTITYDYNMSCSPETRDNLPDPAKSEKTNVQFSGILSKSLFQQLFVPCPNKSARYLSATESARGCSRLCQAPGHLSALQSCLCHVRCASFHDNICRVVQTRKAIYVI